MGVHGTVSLHLDERKGTVCWTFHVMGNAITGASVRDAHGMIVARVGHRFRETSCAKVARTALSLIEAKPHSYAVWLDAKGHPGDLRGKLHAGMTHMQSTPKMTRRHG